GRRPAATRPPAARARSGGEVARRPPGTKGGGARPALKGGGPRAGMEEGGPPAVTNSGEVPGSATPGSVAASCSRRRAEATLHAAGSSVSRSVSPEAGGGALCGSPTATAFTPRSWRKRQPSGPPADRPHLRTVLSSPPATPFARPPIVSTATALTQPSCPTSGSPRGPASSRSHTRTV